MLTRIGGELWFFEDLYPGHTFGFRVKSVLVPEYDTGLQRLMVLDADAPFGRVLVLDGIVQLTELDEYVYHEMLVHPALFSHPNPKSVLIIGGGDLGAAREALKHRGVDSVTVVDIDPEVTRVAKLFFPSLTLGVADDTRLRVLHEDATRIDELFPEGTFDIALLDTTDDVNAAIPLYQMDFLQKVHKMLSSDGVMSRLGGSLFFQRDEVRRVYADVESVFGNASLILFSGSPVYGPPSAFVMARNSDVTKVGRRTDSDSRLFASEISTKWYSPEVHQAAMIIPDIFR